MRHEGRRQNVEAEGRDPARRSEKELVADIMGRAVAVLMNEVIGDALTEGELVNVLPIEGDAKQGIGVLVTEPYCLNPQPTPLRGDLVAWEPEDAGGWGRIVQIATGEYDVADSAFERWPPRWVDSSSLIHSTHRSSEGPER